MDQLHKCEYTTYYNGFAPIRCEEDQEGKLWVDNDNFEYISQVRYCPFCGYPAKNKDLFINKCKEI